MLKRFGPLVLDDSFDLQGKTVLVIGYDTALVGELVKKLMQQQAIVAFIYGDPFAATRLCNETSLTFGEKPLYVHCNLENNRHLETCLTIVKQQLGSTYMAINSVENKPQNPAGTACFIENALVNSLADSTIMVRSEA